MSPSGGNATRTPGAVLASRTKLRGFAVRGSGRDVAVSRFGPRFRGFAGMASARDVVCPPVRTKVSGFGDDQLRGRAASVTAARAIFEGAAVVVEPRADAGVRRRGVVGTTLAVDVGPWLSPDGRGGGVDR